MRVAAPAGRSAPTSPRPIFRRRSAGEAELAAIAPDHGPSIKGRLLGPVAAACVSLAVWGLMATSLVVGLTLRGDPDPT